MLKIDVIHFEALDVITTSIPVAEEKVPVEEAPVVENKPEGGNDNAPDGGESGIPKPEGCDCPDNHFIPLKDGRWYHSSGTFSCDCDLHES